VLHQESHIAPMPLYDRRSRPLQAAGFRATGAGPAGPELSCSHDRM